MYETIRDREKPMPSESMSLIAILKDATDVVTNDTTDSDVGGSEVIASKNGRPYNDIGSESASITE